MRRFFIFIVLVLSAFFITAAPTFAKPIVSKTPSVSVSVAKNRLSASVSFLNLKNVKSISYQLTYDSNKGPQGARGTIRVANNTNSLSRKLLFGTCSKNVCTYHKNLKNIRLSVDYTLRSGGIISYEKRP